MSTLAIDARTSLPRLRTLCSTAGALRYALRATHVLLVPRYAARVEALALLEWDRREAVRAGLTPLAKRLETKMVAARKRALAYELKTD